MVKSLYIAFLQLALTSCQDGCTSSKTLLGGSLLASAMTVTQDCPTGLARCVSGAVEVTEGRSACGGCPCAWKRVRVCERGCELEDVELVRELGDVGALCKGSPSPAALPSVDASGAGTCMADARFVCRAGTVHACPNGAAVPVAVCSFGCAVEEEVLTDARVDIATATNVMCRRALDDGGP